MRTVNASGTVFMESGMPILVGDGVKQPKEGKKMPGVKRLHQESENSGKAEYIFGHMFGAIGILIGSMEKLFCLPLSATLQDGDEVLRVWENKEYKPVSHVVQIIRDAFAAAAEIGDAILLLDAYFFTASALTEMRELAQKFGRTLTVVTRAKMSATAYTEPQACKGRGRPRKKGEPVKLRKLFDSMPERFTKTEVRLYGKEKTIEYLCMDLLWGKGIYRLLRFVLVKDGDRKLILVCTNLDFTVEQIIRLYGYRFKIEVSFRTLKQLLNAFGHHFWSVCVPRLDKFAKSGKADELTQITGEKERERILGAFRAAERYVMLNLIAGGLLQILALKYSTKLEKSSFNWLRTASRTIVTEASMSQYLRRDFFVQFQKQLNLQILQIIRSRIDSSADYNLPNAV
jgi:hypothetical protein